MRLRGPLPSPPTANVCSRGDAAPVGHAGRQASGALPRARAGSAVHGPAPGRLIREGIVAVLDTSPQHDRLGTMLLEWMFQVGDFRAVENAKVVGQAPLHIGNTAREREHVFVQD